MHWAKLLLIVVFAALSLANTFECHTGSDHETRAGAK